MHLSSTSARTALGLAALGAGLATPALAQGLNGQPVQVTTLYPNQGTIAQNQGTQTVNPLGVTFTDGSTNTLVKPTQIVFTFTFYGNFNGYAGTTFNGYQIAETGGSPAPITGFLIDPATNLPGFDASRVTLDPTDVFANFQSLNVTPNYNVTLDIFTAPVPEASTPVSLGLLLALGLGGMVIAAKRKKTNVKTISHPA